ncbi:hypothetical protein [Tenacibaculum aquimarinum]|uniref:hypothetical protein n=1 Tax=Tenacibaculum aquimarinum TaxID=2910675 RepID=UPI001F0B1B42|nr:hypothetical protein [Tenacibaculum aquimarinum]MCH3884400.1 hypothetical protein [Tenacibaculum aquimarinum]
MMRLLFSFFCLFIFSYSYSQCNKEVNTQYYNNSEYSNSIKVSVTFGKGSEISNNYNYISFDQEALYCVIYGTEINYYVKLFVQNNNDNIYATSCSSINSIFNDGYIKGKDQEGRIWKIFKPYTQNNNSYNERPIRKYNPVTSSINTEAIKNTLSSMQNKIDRNRNLVYKQLDAFQYNLDILKHRIQELNNPTSLVRAREELVKNLNNCIKDVDFGSNKSTSSTLSCSNRQIANIEILEAKINNYSIKGNSKIFNIIKISSKTVDYCSIKSIENIGSKTIITFEYISPYIKESWISISPKTYLYDVDNKKNLRLLSVSGVEYSPNRKTVPYNQKTIFKLYFEQLPPNTKMISVIECESDSCFNFYGVEIE